MLLPWVENTKTDKIWMCESVGKVKGIGNQGEAKMNEMKIHTIDNLQRYVWSYGFTKLTIRGFNQTYEHGLETLPWKPMPSIKYHRKAENPYFSIYGEIWVDKLKSSSSMSEFYFITDLIWFMVKEGKKLMKWSVHDDSLFTVHDA